MVIPASDIFRYRGDTVPDKFVLTDDAGVVLDITTGYTFKLTLDTRENPADATTQVFTLSGVVTSGAAGEFEFRPSAGNADQDPGVYFYDVQVIDPSAFKKTLEKGRYEFIQDITKA